MGLRQARRFGPGLLVVLCFTVQPAVRAQGGSGQRGPGASRVDALVKQALRHARDPRALEAIGRLAEARSEAPFGVAEAALERLARERRLLPSFRWLAAWYAEGSALRADDLPGAVERHEKLGLLDEFWLLGPFDDEGERGLQTTYPPERAPGAAPRPEDSFEGKVGPVQWRRWTHEDPEARATRSGYVSFDEALWPREAVCGYASTTVTLRRTGPVELWFGHGGAARLWWNGQLVLTSARYRRRAAPDRHAVRVAARRGANRVLVKVCAQEHAWGFYLRLGRRGGESLTGLRLAPASQEAVPEPGRPAPVRRLTTPFEQLEAVARRSDEGEAVDWDLLEAYVRHARRSGADDPDDPRLHVYAERLAERAPTVARLLLASRLARSRAEAVRWWARARELAPNAAAVRLREAELRESGPTERPALPLWQQVLADRTASPSQRWRAAQRAAGLLQRLGLPRTALELLSKAARAQGRLQTVQGLLALEQALGEASRPAEAEATLEQALERVPGALSALRRRIGLAVARGDAEAAGRLMARYARLEPSRWGFVQLARWSERLGRPAEAERFLRRALRRAPQDPELHRRLGEVLLLLGRRQQAVAAFRASLRLRPQQPVLRQRIEALGLSGGERDAQGAHPGEAMAASEAELRARRARDEGAGHPFVVLQDLTVQQVYDNGLGSMFRQLAVRIGDEAGATQWRTYAIPFEPDSQRVELLRVQVYRGERRLGAFQTFEQSVGEASWRVYYDRRLKVVVLPTLRPGDVVEIRYRVDDVAHRNLFADYFGQLTVLQREVPVVRAEYVLLTPAGRPIATHASGGELLRHERSERGGERVDRWVGEQLPAIVPEPAMPGRTEVAAYVHVSTYQRWEDVARWYWGLVEDQLALDDRLRAVVREQTAGAGSVEEKVRRLYDWVLDNTRYVALEFGIHGYKPYRVTDVARRGFGDCKDKASLLYALLREAGIEAHIVLLRTRRNGAVHEQPASLAVFDHAITYVPALDLYLDGTAEHNGLRELPPMDQGAMVLHVAPGVGELRRTPEAPASAHLVETRWRVDLAADGSATGTVRNRYAGTAAPPLRATLEAEGTRRERVERRLQSAYPGLRLRTVEVEGLQDRHHPVEVTGTVEVPDFARRQGTRLEVHVMPGQRLLAQLAPTPRRRHPLVMLPASTAVVAQALRLPPGARVVELPRTPELQAAVEAQGRPARGRGRQGRRSVRHTFGSRFGKLTVRVEADGGVLETEARLEMDATRIEPSDYPAFRAWLQRAEELLRRPVVVEVSR